MQMQGNIPLFDQLGLLCRNPSVPEAMRTFLCLHQRPNWVRAASGTLEPDFANITAPTEPITGSIGAQAVEEHPRQHWVDGEAWPDYLDDHHHHHHPESQVGRNCAPQIGQTYYIGPDGEAFYYDHNVCRATELNDDTTRGNTSRVNAMRTVHSSNVRRNNQLADGQPRRSPHLQATLAAEIEINGVKALVLFDSGSTTDSITPEFAFVTKAKQIKLEEQVILQLGCVGSRSKISYGTMIPVNLCGITDDVYFNLVNID